MEKVNWIQKVKFTEIKTLGGYTFDEVMASKNTSKLPEYWFQIKTDSDPALNKEVEEERFLFKSPIAESWEFFDPEIENPIRNTDQVYLKFLNVDPFIEPSNHFRKYNCYIRAPRDTIIYNKYWDDLEDKILNGFEVDGVRITGRHFFTINFGRFRAIPVDEYGQDISKFKIWTFLRFLDHQYYLFNELEECLLEGPFRTKERFLEYFPNKTNDDFLDLTLKSFALAKARRKGWTAGVATGVFCYNFTFLESSMNILAAYEKGHYGAFLSTIHTTKSFTDKNTPWVRVTEIKGTREHFIAGINTRDEHGVPSQIGYLSEVQAISFKDNIFKGIGASATVINIEEAGKFDRLLESWPISFEPLLRDGETPIGIAIIGGTAGDMEGGGSEGLAAMMYDPVAYGMKAYPNIYEEKEAQTDAGWFIDDIWYSPKVMRKTAILELDGSARSQIYLDFFLGDTVSAVDEQGNSYRYLSELILNKKRKDNLRASKITYQKFITQQPKYLSEAFLLNESSPFDTATAKEALGQLMIEKLGSKTGTFAIGSGGEMKFKLDLTLQPLDAYPHKGKGSTEGCWVLYEDPMPKTGSNGIMDWRYIAGNDPIDWGSGESSSTGSHSFAATYIIDAITRNVVAEYIGRPADADDYFEQLWRGLEFYNATLLYENNLKSLFTYFKQKNKLYLLAREPETLKGRFGYRSNNRMVGFHATAAANSYARSLINTWSLEEVPFKQDEETGQVISIPRMHIIPSKGLLQEIISWNSMGNFDRISSLGAAMILLFDREYEEDTTTEEDDMMQNGIFLKMRNKMRGGSTLHRLKLMDDYGKLNN